MKDMTRFATGAGVIALGALTALAPRVGLLQVCEYAGKQTMDGHHMPCWYTARTSLILGILIGIIGIVIVIAKNLTLLRMATAALGIAAIVVVLTPTAFNPICKNPDMPCNQGIKPLLIVIGIVAFGLAVWIAISSRTDKQISA